MKRVILIVLDSVGIGYSKDANLYNDVGANTVGNILNTYNDAKFPNFNSLGLGYLLSHTSDKSINLENFKFVNQKIKPIASYAFAQEVSKGKDTLSGHWEIAGATPKTDFGYFTNPQNSFSNDILNHLITTCNLTGSLGNCISSGSKILEDFGEEHILTKKPIFYTSADSVFQIAAHEEIFGLNNLYNLCQEARKYLTKYNIARIIARPFLGNNKSNFVRTSNRKDYSLQPEKNTILDEVIKKGGKVTTIGKISDIFAGKGVSKSIKANGLEDIYNKTQQAILEEKDSSLIFSNFVNFDQDFGHRRDVKGYKDQLEIFDSKIPHLLSLLQEKDILIITADHGCDPTFKGTDHTREYIPIFIYHKNIQPEFLGKRLTYADIGQSVATYLELNPVTDGTNFLNINNNH
jgi:phosphopentomutase